MTESAVKSSFATVVGLTEKAAIHVLHVDDDAGFLKVARQLLEMQGTFQVETALSVEEAKEKMKKHAFDVIVSDYRMPEKDGLQFLKELRDSGDDIPFIMFTGKGREEVAIEALNYGADRYLNKLGAPEAVYGELAHGIRQAVKAKQAEDAVRRQKKRVEQYLDIVEVMLASIDADETITMINKKGCEILGYDKEELMGKNWFDLLVPKGIRDEIRGVFHELMAGDIKPVEFYENLLTTKDGTERLIGFHNTVIKDEKGEIIGVLFSGEDITERKQAEEKVRESEEKYRSLFENARDVIVLMDFKGNVTAINKTAIGYGFKEDEVIGRNMRKFVPKRYWPRLLKELVQLARGKTVKGNIEIVTPKGKKNAEYWSNPIIIDDKAVGVQTVLRDVTERKEAEEELIQLSSAVKMSADSIVISDVDAKIIDVNKAALNMYGTDDKNDLIGKNSFNLIAPEEREKAIAGMKEVLEKGYVKNREYHVITKDGGKIPVEMSVALMKDANGKPIGFVGISRDITERKKAEEALKMSEEKYRRLFEDSSDGLVLIDKGDGSILDCNMEFERQTGRNKAQLLKMKIWDIRPPHLRETARRKLFEVRGGGKGGSMELDFQKPSGEIVKIDFLSRATKNGNREVLQSRCRDITERKETEEALNQEREQQQILLSCIPAFVYYKDAESRLITANKAFAEMVNTPLNQLRGKTAYDLFPREQAEKFHKDDEDVMKSKKPKMNIDEKFSDAEGKLRWASTSKIPYFDEEGKVAGMVGITWDITERKKAEEELEESRKHFRMLFNLMVDPVTIVDEKGKFLDVTDRVEEITGFKKEELVGKNFLGTKIVTAKSKAVMMKNLAKRMMGMHVAPYEVEVLTKDGEKLPYEINAANIEYKGKPADMVVFRDIAERKRMEEKLRVVGRLTRHDVRNKLSTVTGNVYLARQMLPKNHEASKYLSEIESAVGQTVQIFDFARAYERLGVEELVYVNVEKSVGKAVSLFSDLHGIKVMNDCRGLKVLADSLLSRLFYNLIDNSLKHGEKVSRIRVYCEEAGKDRLKLVYEDDGVGIPKAEKEKIFLEGYGRGTGYGLYLIRKMCEVYGWTIRETGKHGKGAQFTITIAKVGKSGEENFRC